MRTVQARLGGAFFRGGALGKSTSTTGTRLSPPLLPSSAGPCGLESPSCMRIRPSGSILLPCSRLHLRSAQILGSCAVRSERGGTA